MADSGEMVTCDQCLLSTQLDTDENLRKTRNLFFTKMRI
jgi:hypothetical protein